MQNNWDRNENSYQQDSMNNAAHHVRGMGDVGSIVVTLPSRSWNIKTFAKSIVVLLATIGMVLLTSALPSQRANAVSPSSVPTLGPDAFNSPVNPGEQFKWHSLFTMDKDNNKHYLTAHWSHSLRPGSLYFTTADSNSTHTGYATNLLAESYDFKKDSQGNMTYKTRPVMYLNDSAGIFNGGNYGTTFSKAAVGHLSDDANGEMSVLFWAFDMKSWNASIKSNYSICPINSTAIWRVNSGKRGTDTPVQVSCFPWNVIYNSVNLGDPTHQLSGGQIDPRTGYLYVETHRISYLDNAVRNAGTSADNNWYNNNQGEANYQIVVWDPTTGHWLSSGPIQPLTLSDRRKYALTNQGWFEKGWRGESHTKDTNYSHFYNRANSYRPAQGITMDARGNLEVIVGGYTTNGDADNSGFQNDPVGSGYFTETLLKIIPLVKNGHLTQPTIKPYISYDNNNSNNWGNPIGNKGYGWAYQVITKFQRKVSANVNANNADFNVNVDCYRSIANYQGKLVEIGRNAPIDGIPDYSTAVRNTPSVALYFDPEHSSVSVAASVFNCTSSQDAAGNASCDVNSKDTDILSESSNRWVRPGEQNVSDMGGSIFTVPSLTSAPILRSIHGTIYWDKNGSGSMKLSGTNSPSLPVVDESEKPRLAGEKVVLYEKQEEQEKKNDSSTTVNVYKAVDETITDDNGNYDFSDFDADNGSAYVNKTYYVRLVQPQVDLKATPETVTIADSSASDGIKNLHVIRVDDSLGNRFKTSDLHLMRNAVQSWALNDAWINRRYPTNERDSAVNQKSGTATSKPVSISSTPGCGVLYPYKVNKVTYSDDKHYMFKYSYKDAYTNNGKKVSNGSNAYQYQNCYGAVSAPYKDPYDVIGQIFDANSVLPNDPTSIGLTDTKPDETNDNIDFRYNPDFMPIHSKISFENSNQYTNIDATADFAVTSVGSYGDANEPPYNTLNANKGPFFTGIDPKALHLGVKIGTYQDGPKNEDGSSNATTKNHPTDDGVDIVDNSTGEPSLLSSLGDGEHHVLSPLGPHEQFDITVSGYPSDQYYLAGWLSDAKPANNEKWTRNSANWAFWASGGSQTENENWNHIPSDCDVSGLDPEHKCEFSPKIVWRATKPGSNGSQQLAPGTYILRVVVAPLSMVQWKSGKDYFDFGDREKGASAFYPDDSESVQNNSQISNGINGAYDNPEYYASDENNLDSSKQNWVNPGEIEDYILKVDGGKAYVLSLVEENQHKMPKNGWDITYQSGNVEQHSIIQHADQFEGPVSFKIPTSSVSLMSSTSNDGLPMTITANNGAIGLQYDANYVTPDGNGAICYLNNNKLTSGSSVIADAETGNVTIKFENSLTKGLNDNDNLVCKVPYLAYQFALPLTGRTIPWASVVGMTICLLGVAGIAIVLVHRR